MWNNPYASWRWLITRLDWKGEHAVADQICGYAEKLTGMLGSSLYQAIPETECPCMHEEHLPSFIKLSTIALHVGAGM